MAHIEYRFLLKLVGVQENRGGELMEFFMNLEPRSGRNKWLDAFQKATDGNEPVVYKTNNGLNAQRMAWSIHRYGGMAGIEDLSPEKPGGLKYVESDEDSEEDTAAPESPAPAAAAPEPAAEAAPIAVPTVKVVIHHRHLAHDGHVSVPTLARMLEDLRHEAAVDDTLGLQKLFQKGSLMLLKSQAIDIIEPIHLGDELVIDLRIVEVGKSSLQMGHQVRRTRDDALVAQASVIAVHVKKKKVANLPKGLDKFVATDLDLPAPPVLEQSSPPAGCWNYKTIVRPSDLDTLQHANHGQVLRYFDDARHMAIKERAYGKNAGDVQATPTRCVASYEEEMFMGEPLTLYTWTDEEKPGTLHFELRRTGRKRIVTARGLFEVPTS